MGPTVKGFTLLELMVTLAVLAVALGIGFPSLAAAIERTRITNTYHLITASLMAARTAAITRAEPITVCPSHDGRHCRDDQVWEDGWIIFADPLRTGEPADAASVLRRIDALNGDFSLRSTSGRPRVRYLPSGRAFGSNVSVRLCARKGARLIGKVVVNNAGRARSLRTSQGEPCPYEP
ncbi:GspH/FimT family pseudopilin [Lysobacter sp. F6437]|uniref:GspH/FimT family pseudopilin n=1 Tax=Lysobacter sp. F6437 TaxID=3459296 RepID=UPI00403E3002